MPEINVDANQVAFKWIKNSVSAAATLFNLDENKNEVPNGRKRKTKRISTRQGTRASERLAARGLGSAFTLSGQRFSNRLANKLKLV
jgi:hypothetical protein